MQAEKTKLVEEIMLFFETRLKDLAKETKRLGHLNHSIYLEAEYMMVALIDEVFLNLPWQGEDEWEKKILEARIYNTHTAGENIFNRIDKLLKENDPIKVELAAIYLESLALGFEGRFRNTANSTAVQDYMDKLYYHIFHHNPTLLEDGQTRKLLPKAYQSTLRQTNLGKLPDPKKLYQLFALIIGLLSFISYLVWVGETYGIESRIRKIIKTITSSDNM